MAAGRIAAVLEELAVVLREFQAGTKALQASKWFINLQRQWRIGGTANVLIKLGTHILSGGLALVASGAEGAAGVAATRRGVRSCRNSRRCRPL